MAAEDKDRANADTPLEIVPLTPDRWDDVAGLFGEGGDPKTCWCMFWRLRRIDSPQSTVRRVIVRRAIDR